MDLRARWQACPSAALAEAIEGRLGEGRPVGGRTQAERLTRWLAVAADQREADLSTLLPVIGEGSAAHIRQKAEALSQWRPHPAIAAALTRVVLEPPYVSNTTRHMWNAILAALAVHQDPRQLGNLQEAALDRWPRMFSPATWPGMVRKLQKVIAALVEAWPSGPPPLDGPLPPSPEEDARLAALLDEVYAHPEDLEARAVYADALIARGDLRGELIALQLGGHSGEDLLIEHGGQWAASISPGTVRVDFARGFPDAVWLDPRGRRPLRHAAREWGLVRRVDFAGLEARRVARSLVRLEVAERAGPLLLHTFDGHPSLHTLSWFGPNFEGARVASHGTSLPALRRLTLLGAAGRAHGFGPPRFRSEAIQAGVGFGPEALDWVRQRYPTLEHLTVCVGLPRLGDWWRWLRTWLPGFAIASWQYGAVRTGWTLDFAGATLRASYRQQDRARRRHHSVFWLARALARLPADVLEHFELRISPDQASVESEHALREALRNQPRLGGPATSR